MRQSQLRPAMSNPVVSNTAASRTRGSGNAGGIVEMSSTMSPARNTFGENASDGFPAFEYPEPLLKDLNPRTDMTRLFCAHNTSITTGWLEGKVADIPKSPNSVLILVLR